jgi:transposase-like protein
MATKEGFKLSQEERRRRIFSDDFKIRKVREIEQKITSIAAVSREYQVTSGNVSNWVKKYSTTYKKSVRLVVEMESDTHKLISLQTKIAELERIVGQKQLLIDFQLKLIELAEAEYGIDIKKKLENEP